jgi:pantetheine-phosphate adenylyltransferase
MDKKAIFPGTFDPFTIGHESVVNRSLDLFNEIVIAIGINPEKKALFPIEKRMDWISNIFKGIDKVKIDKFKGLTVDYCKQVNAQYILRGIRTAADFEYERAIAQNNKTLYPEIETVFLLTLPEHTPVNSTIIKNIYMNGGDVSKFIPASIKEDLKNYKVR